MSKNLWLCQIFLCSFVVFLCSLLTATIAFSFCYPLGDGSVFCNYSRTGMFRISADTMKKLATEPCEGKVLEIYRPDKEWKQSLRPVRDVLSPQCLIFDKGRSDTIDLCKVKSLVNKALSYKRPSWIGRNPKNSDIMLNIATSWSLENFMRLAEAGKLGTPGATTPYGIASDVVGGVNMLLDFISWINVKMIKSKLFIEKNLLDVNYYLDHAIPLSWFELRPGVSKEKFFSVLQKEVCVKDKKVLRLMKSRTVIFKHNEHLKYVSNCAACHHTGTYESCFVCHRVGGIDPHGTLLHFFWHAEAKACAKCHTKWKPLPWPKCKDENHSYVMQECLFRINP